MKRYAAVLSVLFRLPTADNFAQEPKGRSSSGAKILEMFQKADRDGDGKLSREEGRVLPNFAEIDQDRDGFLTPQEIGTFYGPKHATPIPPSYRTRRAIEKDTTPPFSSPDGFKPDDVPVGDPGVNYQDPEFLPGGERMTFVDQRHRVWVAELDPLTGLTRSKTGQDILVAENWAPFKHSQNGPEWCLDRLGQAVAFTMLDEQGVPQLALTRLGPRGAETVQILTRGPQRNFSPFGTLCSQDASARLVLRLWRHRLHPLPSLSASPPLRGRPRTRYRDFEIAGRADSMPGT